jgi:hypothetical protein
MNSLFRIVCLLYLLGWITLGTLRSSGLDYSSYLEEFVDPVHNKINYEIGYLELLEVVRPLGGFWIVLLIANTTFLVTHLRAILRIVSWPQAVVFMFYLSYVGLFLIYGSPRRLIAFSLITYCIFVLTLNPEKFRMHFWRHALITGIAASFHVSAIIFVPVLIAYTYGLSLFKSVWRILLIAGVSAVIGRTLYTAGAVEYMVSKTYYYVYIASSEQGYLDEVPNVISGLIKRFVAIFLVWYGTVSTPEQRRPLLDLCVIETALYGAFGSLSPVLAVASTYFSAAFLVPCLLFRGANEVLSPRGLLFLSAGASYFLPTALGLLRLFGHEYAL